MHAVASYTTEPADLLTWLTGESGYFTTRASVGSRGQMLSWKWTNQPGGSDTGL
jgi:hypothetical protein